MKLANHPASSNHLIALAQCTEQAVHGAIGPEHIMLEGGQANGAVSLVGFSRAFKVDIGGAACEALNADSAVSISAGTVSIRTQAPEQLGGEARLASDMYALGSTLLCLLKDAEGTAHSVLCTAVLAVQQAPELPQSDTQQQLSSTSTCTQSVQIIEMHHIACQLL